MSLLELILLAIALAMDCFAVSIASGIIQKQICWRSFLTMALFFGLFQGLMPLLGWALTYWASTYVAAWDHWIAFSILLFLGIKMIYEHFRDENSFASFSPTTFVVILTLAIATSIDAFAVGISFACLGIRELQSLFIPIIIIGAVSFIFSIIGNVIGAVLGHKIRLNAELWGGLLLIGIGTKILFEHLCE
jgi:putative Mn2+ efflux pump MntP